MKVEYIICENKAERNAVFRKLEDEGYKWGNKELPTEWNLDDSWGDKSIALHLDQKPKVVLWAFTRSEHRQRKDAVLAQDYLSKRKPILITRKGRVVTAENKNTGEKAIATCSPDDTFDFGTGAMIAVARLIAQSDKGITKDAETVLRQLLGDDVNNDSPAEEEPTNKFKVGNLVTLKEGVKVGDRFEHLDVEEGEMFDQGYHKPMKVVEITKVGSYYCIPADGNGTGFYYHEGMLEAWNENKIHEGDRVHVKKGCTKDRYDTYYQWLKDNISDIDLLLGFERKDSVSTTDTYTVVKIAPHGHFGDVQLAFIKRTNGLGDTFSYLYDVEALEKVTE